MEPFKEIPTYTADTDEWTTTVFQTRKEMYDFVKDLFKQPGKYEFDDSIIKWNKQARDFNDRGLYCDAPKGSTDFRTYWDDQKVKCRRGVIYKNGDKTWYLPREYYMWLNFLPIYNKAIKKFTFPDVRDIQYHMALYLCLAELDYKHAAILKKRQIAYSYYMCAKIYNYYIFEKNAILKIGASLKTYIDENGSWKYLNEYRDFINEHTAWIRENNPEKPLNWYQRSQKEVWQGASKKVIYTGKKSRITGTSFEKRPTANVGGPTDIFWYEEGGIAPTMDKTIKYILPSMKDGAITTGICIVGGSVGDLDQCGPLKKMINSPYTYDMYGVTTDLIDSKGTIAERSLFLPEQWSMPPFIDTHGNSKVEEALTYILEKRKSDEKKMSPYDYQLSISQNPINIEEAFQMRDSSIWPLHLIQKQKKRIEDHEYPIEYVDLDRGYDEGGNAKVIIKKSNRAPIMDHPIDPKMADKRAVVCIYERPPKDIKHGMFYGSIDPIEIGKTMSSTSICSVYIYRVPIQVFKEDANGKKSFYVEPGKLVASWCGRYDDPNHTHDNALKLIELYQAYTTVERNKPGFITYVVGKNKQHFLAPASQFSLSKELDNKEVGNQQYGWANRGNLFAQQFVPMGIDFLEEEIDVIEITPADEEGGKDRKVKVIYGIERIPDIMLFKEMEEDGQGENADRLISFCALVAFVASQLANTKPMQRHESEVQIKKPKENTNFRKGAFNNMGSVYKRSAFKNVR